MFAFLKGLYLKRRDICCYFTASVNQVNFGIGGSLIRLLCTL